MIYPSADKLNKIGSKYKLISMAATRAKQLKAGMKPLIETDSKNPLTIAFEEIAAGVITANIQEIDELSIDYTELTRTSAQYVAILDEDKKIKDDEDDTVLKLDKTIQEQMSSIPTEKVSKTEIAESIKSEATQLDDIHSTELDIENDDIKEEIEE